MPGVDLMPTPISGTSTALACACRRRRRRSSAGSWCTVTSSARRARACCCRCSSATALSSSSWPASRSVSRGSHCTVLFGPRLTQTMIRSSVFHHKADYDTTKGVQKVVVQPWLMLFAVFACLGFLSPANRGALMTCSIVLWVCLGTPAGYVSARIYKSKSRSVDFRTFV